MIQPLEIGHLSIYNARLGLCPCPARPAAFGRPADLDGAVEALRAWPAGAVVSLMEAREFELLGLGELPARLRARFPVWMHLPIRDGDVPGTAWFERWRLARRVIAALLVEGDNVVVHCLAGLGRTGTVAGMCLIDAGICEGREAIDRVRRAWSVHAVQTPEQEALVERYRPARRLHPDRVHDEIARIAEAAGTGPLLDREGRLDRPRVTRLLGGAAGA